jgi:hypothetical protein
MSRLFGELATTFGNSPEDLATEGLCHLLRHRVAAKAFIDYLDVPIQDALLGTLRFSTQEPVEEGEGRLDLRGTGDDGRAPLLVESKFWAGLTANQPNAYLRELEEQPGGVLLFIVPQPRLASLWPKVRREALEEFAAAPHEDSDADYTLWLENGTTLLMRSWQEVLDTIMSAARREGENSLLEDLRQVRGLCDRHNEADFQPLRGEEIGQSIGKRIQQLHTILRDLPGHLGPEWAEDTKLSITKHRYAFTTQVHNTDSAIGIEYYWWAEDGSSPLWLRIETGDPTLCQEAIQALEPEIRAFPDTPSDCSDLLSPLALKLGVERPEVLKDLAGQLGSVAERLDSVLKDAPE